MNQTHENELVSALRWMANSLNWHYDDDGFMVKRPEYSGQQIGIILHSWGIVPWKFAEEALAKSGHYRFDKTFCSQCGGEFGPANNGYSDCKSHEGKL